MPVIIEDEEGSEHDELMQQEFDECVIYSDTGKSLRLKVPPKSIVGDFEALLKEAYKLTEGEFDLLDVAAMTVGKTEEGYTDMQAIVNHLKRKKLN